MRALWFAVLFTFFLLLSGTSSSVRAQSASIAVPVAQSAIVGPGNPFEVRGPASIPPPTGAPSDPTSYDEQIGMTFTQSFTSLAYNVTAIEQSDPSSGTGPAYLLNGLSNQGYWYQVGLSWNWNPGYTPGTGFDMNYEVFNSSGNSIFPANGGGGLQSFNGPVNQGDTVLLNLYFSSTYGVVLLAKDYNTGSTTYMTYSAEGASQFDGDASNTANSNGFFTGLMTEWYHSSPFYSDISAVTYSNPYFALTSAWMWIDEFSCPNTSCSGKTVLFSDATQGPVSYANPTQLQAFSSNGATEYSDAYKLITGSAGYATLTMTYSLSGGGTPVSPPILHYVSGGSPQYASLSLGQNVFQVDQGSSWSVTSQLLGQSASERWATNHPTTGVASTTETISLNYFHQYLVSFQDDVTGGGSGYGQPTVTWHSFGIAASGGTQSLIWADAASTYTFSNPLPGSSSNERWEASPATGVVSSSGTISVDYYHQFDFLASYSVSGGSPTGAPALQGSQFGQQEKLPITPTPISYWFDSGSPWNFTMTLAGSVSGERWAETSPASGIASSSITLSPEYFHQYYLTITTNDANGGSIPDSGWHNSSQPFTLNASPTAGWILEKWEGMGEGAYSGNSTSTMLSMTAPISEQAVFYPGLTINVTGSGSVSYTAGVTRGSTGSSLAVYVIPGSSVSVVANPSSFLYEFQGWKGSTNSSIGQSSVIVNSPAMVQATFGYNYMVIGSITAVIIAAGTGLLMVFKRSRGRGKALVE